MNIGMNQFINTGADDDILKSLPVEDCPDELVKAMNKQGLVQKEVTVQGANGKTFTRKQWVRASDDQGSGTGKQGVKPPDAPSQTLKDFYGITGKETPNELQKIKQDAHAQMSDLVKQAQKATAKRSSDAGYLNTSAQGRQKAYAELSAYVDQVTQHQAQTSTQAPKQSSSGISFDLPAHGDAKKAVTELLSSGKSRDDIMAAATAAGITWKENDNPGINWMRASMAIQKHMKSGGSTAPTVVVPTPKADAKSQVPQDTTPTTSKPIKGMSDDEIKATPEFQKAVSMIRNQQDYKVAKLVRDCLSILAGESDVSMGVDITDTSWSSRAGNNPNRYKEDCQDFPAVVKALGLQCRVVDTTHHTHGYVGVRGRRVYAQTYKSKRLLIFKKDLNKTPYDDSEEIGSHILYVRDGKIQHGILTVESADYKPGVCLVQAEAWGSPLQEVDLREIKGDWDVKGTYRKGEWVRSTSPGFDATKNNGNGYQVFRLYGSHFAAQNEVTKKQMIADAEKLPASLS